MRRRQDTGCAQGDTDRGNCPSASRLVSAPRSAERSSAPQVRPVSRALALRNVPTTNIAAAVSVASATIFVAPSGNPFSASRTASLASRCMTDGPPSAFGSMIASGAAAITASRSASVRPVSIAFTRTRRRGWPFAPRASFRKASAVLRASSLLAAEIESSRSTISASAPLVMPLSSFFGLSPGTKRRERKVYAGRLSMKACRRHSATSLLFWL